MNALSFEEFRDGLCLHCSHCETILTNGRTSNFCYDLYKKNPQKFMLHCYAKLRKFKNWPTTERKEHEMFRNIFCKSGICNGKPMSRCSSMNGCIYDFIVQITETSNVFLPMTVHDKNTTQPAGKKIKVYSSRPEVAVICGGSKEWVEKING